MSSEEPIDRLYAEVLAAGERVPALRAALARLIPDEKQVLALLRRPLPIRCLELLGTQPPWEADPRILAGVVLNPRTPAPLAQRLLPALFWRDLAEVALSPRVTAAVRAKAEAALRERLPDMRLGDRVTLARVATAPVLSALLSEIDRKVLDACLPNPRLREADLLLALRKDTVSRSLIEAVLDSPRWTKSYNVGLALALQPRTPLALALGRLRSLTRRDLLRVASTPGLVPLVQAAAARVAAEPGRVGPET